MARLTSTYVYIVFVAITTVLRSVYGIPPIIYDTIISTVLGQNVANRVAVFDLKAHYRTSRKYFDSDLLDIAAMLTHFGDEVDKKTTRPELKTVTLFSLPYSVTHHNNNKLILKSPECAKCGGAAYRTKDCKSGGPVSVCLHGFDMKKWTRMLHRRIFGDLTKQLAFPTNTISGRMVTKMMTNKYAFLEKSAVKLLNIGPHDRVLEIGFGAGVGIKCASWRVEEGSGRVYGVDISKYMVETASKYCIKQIKQDTVELHCADVTMMPFPDNLFDRVFHCNSFYFWHRLHAANQEIFRVMKPNSKMVTTLYIDDLKELLKEGELKKRNTDPLLYMNSLEGRHFKDVCIKYLPYNNKLVYQAIYARKPDLEELKEIQLRNLDNEFDDDFETMKLSNLEESLKIKSLNAKKSEEK